MGHPIRSSKDFAPPFPTILQGEQMKFHFGCKPFLAAILGLVLATTACSSQWISVALADLPVLTQMALNIGTLVTTMDSGSPITPAETAGIQAISNEASKDLNLLQSLYNDYKTNPNATTLQKINDAITSINQNLPAVLQAAHIGDPTLLARVSAGVNLILTTIESFAALMPLTQVQPQSRVSVSQARVQPVTASVQKKVVLANSAELKKQWNQQVCAPAHAEAFRAGFSGCSIK